MTIMDVKEGQSFRILGFGEGVPAYRQKLLAMGLTRGTVVKLAMVAPLGDPIQVRVRGYSLSLRKQQAAVLNVEVVG